MDQRRNIAGELQKGMADTISFFESLSSSQLKVKVYQDGSCWNAQQILGHLVAIERSMQRLFNNMLSGAKENLYHFDVDRYNRSQTQKMDAYDRQALVEQFRTVRLETISIVENMKETDLELTGRHPFHGMGTLGRFIRWAYEHARIHQEEIRNVLDQL